MTELHATEEQRAKWHRGSRFWRGALELQRLAFLALAGVLYFAPDHVPAALGVFGLLGTTIYGGGAYVNAKERNPEVIAATAQVEAARAS